MMKPINVENIHTNTQVYTVIKSTVFSESNFKQKRIAQPRQITGATAATQHEPRGFDRVVREYRSGAKIAQGEYGCVAGDAHR